MFTDPFLNLPLYTERKKTICLLPVAFADARIQTQAACAASECAIHYSIAYWLQIWNFQFKFE